MKQIISMAIAALFIFCAHDSFSQVSQAATETNTKELSLLRFQGDLVDNKINFDWKVSVNEATDHFELEKSIDGKNFFIACLMFSSEKNGEVEYFFSDRFNHHQKMFYRLKMVDKNKKVIYSKQLVFTPEVKYDEYYWVLNSLKKFPVPII